MKLNTLKLFFNIFILTLIIENIFINSFQIKEKYPKAFYPFTNNNLFLVTENGIRIYDSNLETIVKSYDFPSDDRKITSTYEAQNTAIANFADDDNPNYPIIVLVKGYLYVFNYEGNFLFEQDLTSIITSGKSFNLIDFGNRDNTYYYVIAYYNGGYINIKYLSFSTEDSSLQTIAEITFSPTDSNGYSTSIAPYGLSCEKMNLDDEYVITCFYQIVDTDDSPISIRASYFKFYENEIVEDTPEYGGFVEISESISIIKSATDDRRALICYTNDDETLGNCVGYNIEDNSFTSEVQYFSSCKSGYNGMEVYYFSNGSEYMFICSDSSEPKGFHSVLLSSDDFSNDEYEIKDEPDYIYGGNCNNINSFNVIDFSNEYTLINDCETNENEVFTIDYQLGLLSEGNNYPIFSDLTTETDTITEESEESENSEESEESEESEISEESENSQNIETNNIDNNLSENIITNNSNIVFDISTKSKEEIISNTNKLILNKNPKISYVINGSDYTVIISPINVKVEESTVNIDFSKCEEVLKEKYPNKEFRIVQINIENKIENSLVDQVEYKIYDENGDQMDLSICENVDILIEYEIKNSSYLNLEEIKNFQNMGIDIFNLNHEFFNDICFPYSDNNTNSDMILSDRVADIYQNYSLCGDNCEYISFNLEKVSTYCNCNIKQKVSSEPEKGNFKSYIMKTFLYSNFGVIKCYNLVFSLAGKLTNIGFWVFGVMIISHIPLYIMYCINRTTKMVSFINKEMEEKGYNTIPTFHKKKTNNLKKKFTNEVLNNMNENTKIRNHLKQFHNNPPKKKYFFSKNNNDINEDEDIKKTQKFRSSKFVRYNIKKHLTNPRKILLIKRIDNAQEINNNLNLQNLDTIETNLQSIVYDGRKEGNKKNKSSLKKNKLSSDLHSEGNKKKKNIKEEVTKI